MYPVDGGKAVVKMTDEMKEASLRQGSDNTRKGLGISRVAFVMTLQAYAWTEKYFRPHPPTLFQSAPWARFRYTASHAMLRHNPSNEHASRRKALYGFDRFLPSHVEDLLSAISFYK